MEKVVLNVEGMSCGHCVKAVNTALGQLPGVAHVDVDLGKKTVSAEYDPLKVNVDKIKAKIEDQGYEVVGG